MIPVRNLWAEIAGRVVLAWMNNKPFSKEARARRKAARAERKAERRNRVDKVFVQLPDGTLVERTEPLIQARTSTKAAIGAAVVAYPGYQVVEFIQSIDFPWPWLEDFTNGPGFVWLCATIVPILIARFTKSPVVPSAV